MPQTTRRVKENLDMPFEDEPPPGGQSLFFTMGVFFSEWGKGEGFRLRCGYRGRE